jgi:hypothetical protein
MFNLEMKPVFIAIRNKRRMTMPLKTGWPVPKWSSTARKGMGYNRMRPTVTGTTKSVTGL